MGQPTFSLAPRTRGRAPAEYSVEFVRELGPGDLVLLASERGVSPPMPLKLNDRHHSLARCIAQGMTDSEASIVTGYDPSRISILKQSPLFRQLVHTFRAQEDDLHASFIERATILSLTAMNSLQDDLENEENPLPAGMKLEIAKFGSDRIGHAPVQKTFNVNANVNLGSRLGEARKRLEAVVQSSRGTLDDSDDS